MGNKASTQVVRSREITKNTKKELKKQQKQRQKEKKQSKVKKLRSTNKNKNKNSPKNNKNSSSTRTKNRNGKSKSQTKSHRPRTPRSENKTDPTETAPKLELTSSNIEETQLNTLTVTTTEGNDSTLINQFFPTDEAAISPASLGTRDTSFNSSFGMDSFDSLTTSQRNIVIDTSEMNNQKSALNEDSASTLPSSPLFSIQESDDHQKRLFPNEEEDDADQFSDASSQPDGEDNEGGDGGGGDGVRGINTCASDDGSLLSTGSCTDFDNMSKGMNSTMEMDNMSRGSIPYITSDNHLQRASSSSVTPSFYSHHSASTQSIHSRRTTKLRRSRSGGSKGHKRPTASNAFETLPRHLIQTGLVRQVTATLRDTRFVTRRIEKLGAAYASKIHASDFELLKRLDQKNNEKREQERDVEGGGLEATLPTSQHFADGDDYFSVLMDSFDLFLKVIMEFCGIEMDSNIFEVDENCEELLEEGDEETEDTSGRHLPEEEEEDANIEKKEPELERKISPLEGGKAILVLGKFLQSKEWIDDAMYYYRHALYLLLLEVDIDEPRLLDEGEDCDGLFYADVANEGSQVSSSAHELLGIVLTKMGDVHGKNLEVNDALRAYRASQVFWGAYIEDHQVSKKEQCDEKDENLDELTDYAASVEGLALSHNRVGGVYTSKGDLPSALESFHAALDLQIDALGEIHLEVGKTLHNIGVCHRHNDDWDEALNYYQKAHVTFVSVLGKDHLDTARTLHNIGGVYRRKQMYHEAFECFKEVLRIRRKNLGDDHPSVSITLVSIAAALRRSGKIEEANKFYAAAVR